MKLCKGAILALAVSYGLTYCHTTKSKLTLEQKSDSLTVIHITNPTNYILLPIEEEAAESQVLLDTGEATDTDMDIFNLPEKRLVMDRTKSGIVDFGKKSVSHEIEVHDRRKTTSINYIDDFALATWAPIKKENKYTLDVFVDKCSVEIFLNGGKVAMTNLIFPSEPYNRMCFYSKGGSFQVDSFKAYRLGL